MRSNKSGIRDLRKNVGTLRSKNLGGREGRMEEGRREGGREGGGGSTAWKNVRGVLGFSLKTGPQRAEMHPNKIRVGCPGVRVGAGPSRWRAILA